MNINNLIEKINGTILKVNKVLGAGFPVTVYENALLVELRNIGLHARTKVLVTVRYEGEVVGEYVGDILVEDKVLLTLKAVEYLEKRHEAELLSYLNVSEYNVGLLVNFTYPKPIIIKLESNTY